ncbi:undecaprenyl-diphosphate phosphatase [Nitrosococcus watsonii]|uniref:Undecaprenyl-diphosphatase n=1 Tax=Nitrosococcus watsoni (strain C-113) TaxID=105559 RepID=D8K913_NITWC|nr:undecaprenyl-diphosphate phosphatase [Nitrosococcus watsonii]ADJ27223.1 undecaprenol kinase [Nitrosococcus watsonii C-113]
MDFIHILALAILQGLTEFLPISSSAHLILLPVLAGWTDQGLAFDVAVHLGTLAAVIGYFRLELARMARDWLQSLASGQQQGESRLAWAVLLGTLPVGLVGIMLNESTQEALRSPLIIAWSTVGFGFLLAYADWAGKQQRNEHTLTWRDVLFIGLAQALALIPGTSRSGITITAGLILGLTREGAARFSFLLAIPVILLAGGLAVLELLNHTETVDWNALALGALISGLCAYACIHYFLKFLQHIGMLPFAVYRVLLGALLFYLFS